MSDRDVHFAAVGESGRQTDGHVGRHKTLAPKLPRPSAAAAAAAGGNQEGGKTNIKKQSHPPSRRAVPCLCRGVTTDSDRGATLSSLPPLSFHS